MLLNQAAITISTSRIAHVWLPLSSESFSDFVLVREKKRPDPHPHAHNHPHPNCPPPSYSPHYVASKAKKDWKAAFTPVTTPCQRCALILHALCARWVNTSSSGSVGCEPWPNACLGLDGMNVFICLFIYFVLGNQGDLFGRWHQSALRGRLRGWLPLRSEKSTLRMFVHPSDVFVHPSAPLNPSMRSCGGYSALDGLHTWLQRKSSPSRGLNVTGTSKGERGAGGRGLGLSSGLRWLVMPWMGFESHSGKCVVMLIARKRVCVCACVTDHCVCMTRLVL